MCNQNDAINQSNPLPSQRNHSATGSQTTRPPTTDLPESRFARQMSYILELDKLKTVLRQTMIGQGRRENTAEHSWHLAMLALLLGEYANESVDLLRVIKMALVHDIVEIDAGDTFVYDTAGEATKVAREQLAADRIFNLLPPDQAADVRALWDEYEARATAEARFAYAIDRLIPVMLNHALQGKMWRQHGITASRVLARNESMADGSRRLWDYVQEIVTDAVAKKYIQE